MKLPNFPVEGGCQCGAVRYRLKAAPLGVYACHCKDCQRFSSTTHALSMVVNFADAEVVAGEMVFVDKVSDSGRIVRMLGCAKCGTKIWNEPLSAPALKVLKPGTLDDMSWARPVGAIWTDSAVSWANINWDEPHFPGQAPNRQPLFDAYAAEIAKG